METGQKYNPHKPGQHIPCTSRGPPARAGVCLFWNFLYHMHLPNLAHQP